MEVSMHRIAILAVFSSLLFRASILDAGTATQQFKVVKDPLAVTIIQAAVTAMGGTQALLNYQDSVASGTLTVYGGNSPSTLPITLKCKGTQETRVELQKSNGTTVRIVNTGQGVIERPEGTVIHLTMNNTIAERVNHIPLLSIFGEYLNGNISVQYKGTAQVNGQSTSIVAVSYVPTTDPVQGPIYSSMTQTLFYVDQATGLIDKIQYSSYDETNSNSTQKVEIYIGNYQTVNGISVPFHQTTYTDGALYSDLVLSSVSFNVGLLDSEFTLPN